MNKEEGKKCCQRRGTCFVHFINTNQKSISTVIQFSSCGMLWRACAPTGEVKWEAHTLLQEP